MAARERKQSAEGGLLRFDEAADRLNIKIKTLRKWAARGLVASTRIGPRAVRIPNYEIERIISSGLRPARAERENRRA